VQVVTENAITMAQEYLKSKRVNKENIQKGKPTLGLKLLKRDSTTSYSQPKRK
jgi:hypothetical protein